RRRAGIRSSASAQQTITLTRLTERTTMQPSTELELAADAHEAESFGSSRFNAPLFFSLREIARNDAAYANDVSPDDETGAWARHALAANGFGGSDSGATGAATSSASGAVTLDAAVATARDARVAGVRATLPERPDRYELHRWALHQRDIMIGE